MASTLNQATSCGPESKTTDGSLTDIHVRLCKLLDRALGQCRSLEEIGDRAFGPAPIGGTSDSAPPLEGLAQQIATTMAAFKEAQNRMHEAIQRVGSAI